MHELIKLLLSLSASGTLLLLLILGLKPFYKDKFSRHWQYYIWMIVALRFLIPFMPDTINVGGLLEKFGMAAVINEIPVSPDIPILTNGNGTKQDQTQAQDSVQAQVLMQSQPQLQPQPQKSSGTMASATVRSQYSIYLYMFFVWAALSLLLFVRKITLYQGFIQYIKAGSTEVSDIRLLNLLSDCAEKLHIKTRVELYQNALIASPVMIGFFRPGIVLPACELEDKELSYVFTHELIHYRQKDMFYKWLVQTVVCVHWFNPFAYLLGKEVNQACELACDEKVMSTLDDQARRGYGDTLISFLKTDHSYKNALASVTLTEGAEQLKERLGAIMNFKKKPKLVAVLSFVAAILLFVGGFSIGVYATAPTNSYIGLDAAKNAALAHAGIQESDTRYCNSWMEYKGNRPACYQVEFAAGDVEYEYEIDLYSGAILEYDKEYRNYAYRKPTDGNTNSGSSTSSGNGAGSASGSTNSGGGTGSGSNIGSGSSTGSVDSSTGSGSSTGSASGSTGFGNSRGFNSSVNSAGGSSTSGSANYIGQDAAKNAALAHAGIQESNTLYCNGWMEYENKRPAYYEVEFVAGDIEYEYDIDLYSGAVLKCDTEYHNYPYPKPNGGNMGSDGSGVGSGSNGTSGGAVLGNSALGSAADIGQDAAKQAAFSHAGVSESQVYHLKVEQDYDDGWLEYEVKFKYNGMEYEYDIDAATGNILKFDRDND